MRRKTSRRSTRRGLLSRLWALLGGLVLVQVLAGAGAFVLSAARRGRTPPEDPRQETAPLPQSLPANEIQPGTVRLLPGTLVAVARLEDGGLLALSRRCTHLGCALAWDAKQGVFRCPCHGSLFTLDGRVRSGPASRPLARHRLEVRGGQVLVFPGPLPGQDLPPLYPGPRP